MTPNQRQRLASRLAATEHRLRVIYVSTYIPRECGLATYTKDLTTAINILNPNYLSEIAAIDDAESGGERKHYPWEVKRKVEQENLSSWLGLAKYINESSADVVNIQHEFGLYGGEMGEFVIEFMKVVKKPMVVCLHTVLPKPTPKMRKIVREIGRRSSAIIVIVDAAAKILEKAYGIDPHKVVTIPHGVPDIPFGPSATFKRKLGYRGWNIISSFGLLSRSKGYQHLIAALPAVIKRHPKTKLLILGETHPVVKRHSGEVYRKSLENQVKKLGLEKNVEFVNRYLTLREIVEYLRATDIYVTPYPNMEQVSSGTLSYAVSAGKPCISTPYTYAKEVLSGGRGLLMERNNSADLAKKILKLLDNPKSAGKMARLAYDYGRNMIWPSVALRHLDLFEIVAQEHEKRPA